MKPQPFVELSIYKIILIHIYIYIRVYIVYIRTSILYIYIYIYVYINLGAICWVKKTCHRRKKAHQGAPPILATLTPRTFELSGEVSTRGKTHYGTNNGTFF